MQQLRTFENCALAKQMHDELQDQRTTLVYHKLMTIYESVLRIEMKKRKVHRGVCVKVFLKEIFREGESQVKILHGNLKIHKKFEKIHVARILDMYNSSSNNEGNRLVPA